MTPTLHGFPVCVAQHMAGTKKAVKMNGVIYVSPAMYDLMSHAEGEELRRLLEAIPLLDLGVFDLLAGLGMTVEPPRLGEEE